MEPSTVSAQAGIIAQLDQAQLFTRMALKGLSEAQWNQMPETLGTHVNWQFGHILISNYHLGVQLIVGHRPDLIDAKRYATCYGRGSSPSANADLRPGKTELLDTASRLDAVLREIVSGLSDADLATPVSTFVPGITHKLSALLFCGAHQMYHNGQLGLLRKALAASPPT
jgi:DinB superfamily